MPESDEQVAHRIGVVRLVIAGAVVCLALLATAGLLDGEVTVVDALRDPRVRRWSSCSVAGCCSTTG